MIRPGIQTVAGQSVHQPHHRRQRIVGAMRIGGMALITRHGDMRVERSTTAYFNHLTHMIRAGRLAHQTHRHLLPLGVHPIEQSDSAIGRWPLFITSDRDDHCTIFRWGHRDKVNRRCDKSSHAGFHICRATAVQQTIFLHRAERINRPVNP